MQDSGVSTIVTGYFKGIPKNTESYLISLKELILRKKQPTDLSMLFRELEDLGSLNIS
jgi:hypothetical protein